MMSSIVVGEAFAGELSEESAFTVVVLIDSDADANRDSRGFASEGAGILARARIAIAGGSSRGDGGCSRRRRPRSMLNGHRIV